ncbi:MAG: nucleoside deaminase [Anaerolineales bacterium]|jgi:tRNA(Arg) A34 adenosine deaminase TadA|nr:nucleoside deaminase [Anaerolineales bacterium]
MWETLAPPWQAALEMAWEAYCANTVPIGAVVADKYGNVVSRGRNRIMDQSAPAGQVCSNELAHAEINALLSLKLSYEESRQAALYTTMEPCPLCMGAFFMSDVKTIHFAARDPWAGSVNLLGTTPYLSRKPIKVFAPFNTLLEKAILVLHIEWNIFKHGENILTSQFFNEFRAILPDTVDQGLSLYRSGELRNKQKMGFSADQVFNWLTNQVQ